MKPLVFVAMLALPGVAQAQPLELVCVGRANSLAATQTYASAFNNGGDSISGSATSYRRVNTDEQLRIRLDGAGGGKVKMPAQLIPPISRGKEGWWDFVKLDVAEEAIRGEFSMNWLNRPKVMIDRRTGEVDVRGYGFTFSGMCEKAPEAAEERKF